MCDLEDLAYSMGRKDLPELYRYVPRASCQPDLAISDDIRNGAFLYMRADWHLGRLLEPGDHWAAGVPISSDSKNCASRNKHVS